MKNEIDNHIDANRQFEKDTKNKISDLFRSLGREDLLVVRNYLSVCEGCRTAKNTQPSRLGFAFRNPSRIDLRGCDNGTWTFQVEFFNNGKRMFLYMPTTAICSRAGFLEYIKSLKEALEAKKRSIRLREIEQVSACILKNRKLAKKLLKEHTQEEPKNNP